MGVIYQVLKDISLCSDQFLMMLPDVNLFFRGNLVRVCALLIHSLGKKKLCFMFVPDHPFPFSMKRSRRH